MISEKQGSVGRRIEQALNSLISHDYESALVHLFPALDKTAKLRRPKDKVGARIKLFLADEEEFISYLAFRISIKNSKFDGYTFPEAIYKFGRTTISHEGELDPRLKFTTNNEMNIGTTWELPVTYIAAMIAAIIVAKENSDQFLLDPKNITLQNKKLPVNEIWGKKEAIYKLLSQKTI